MASSTFQLRIHNVRNLRETSSAKPLTGAIFDHYCEAGILHDTVPVRSGKADGQWPGTTVLPEPSLHVSSCLSIYC